MTGIACLGKLFKKFYLKGQGKVLDQGSKITKLIQKY